MSVLLSYTLRQADILTSVRDLESIIHSNFGKSPSVLYACLQVNSQNTAYRICCDDDIVALKRICAGRAVSILFTPQTERWDLPFRGFQHKEQGSFPGADFEIENVDGAEDGSDVEAGAEISKQWRLRVAGSCSLLSFKCVEGDYWGVVGTLEEKGGGGVVVTATVRVANREGWSSSVWRIFSADKAFGPWLWVEVNVVKR
jgi:hypothetical protein